MTDLLTQAEAARRLSISIKTLRGHVNDGALPYVVVSRGKKRERHAFDPADLDRFIASRKKIGGVYPAPTSVQKRRRSTSAASVPPVYDFLAQRAEREKAKNSR